MQIVDIVESSYIFGRYNVLIRYFVLSYFHDFIITTNEIFFVMISSDKLIIEEEPEFGEREKSRE